MVANNTMNQTAVSGYGLVRIHLRTNNPFYAFVHSDVRGILWSTVERPFLALSKTYNEILKMTAKGGGLNRWTQHFNL